MKQSTEPREQKGKSAPNGRRKMALPVFLGIVFLLVMSPSIVLAIAPSIFGEEATQTVVNVCVCTAIPLAMLLMLGLSLGD